ncbi:hypothetical protein PG994_012572 [Apiospora phragmitis]|uniref:Uncharacterized protein n=1 Tax=Apiospora phragmitis TaxID=2905665 RepID=A0ABR1TAU5_9PEZI
MPRTQVSQQRVIPVLYPHLHAGPAEELRDRALAEGSTRDTLNFSGIVLGHGEPHLLDERMGESPEVGVPGPRRSLPDLEDSWGAPPVSRSQGTTTEAEAQGTRACRALAGRSASAAYSGVMSR